MSGGVVIDLCDSSIDEGELTRPSTASSENTRLSRCQLLVGDCFWDSSDEDDPIRIPTRKDRQRRRKSKVVTPEDCHWKKALDNAYCSSVEDFSPDGKHQSKRKQPRILFSKHIVKNHDSKSRAKLENESNSSRKITAISFRPSTLDLSSSDDDSLLNDSVFSKKIHPTISSNSGARIFCALPKCSSGNKSEVMIKLHSAANDDKEGGAQKNKESNDHTTALSRQPSNVSLSSHVHLTFNPYAKQGLHNKLSSQSQSQSPHLIRQILQYPNVGPVSGRQHEDLRAKILLALWHHCRTLVSATFNLAKLDSYSRRIRELALATEFPIRSLEEFVGSGPSVDKGALQEAVRSGGIDKIQTPYNRDVRVHGYYSIAEAALVSILEHIESRASASGVDLGDEAQAVSFCRQNEQWIYLSDLIPKIDSRLNAETAPALLTRKLDEDNGEAFYTNPSTRSAEYKQLEQLTKTEVKSDMPLFKSHRKDKRLCYELTLRGLQKALFIRGRLFPEPPGYIRSSKLFSNSVEPCFQGICLVVDHREGGGACRKLHSICQGLDMRRVPYVVTKLDIGDYAFVCMKTQRLLPIIIERKSIQDVAQSIWDGRWVSQKLRMYQGQQVFGFECSRLAYLIEGHADGQELTGGAMGQLHFRVNRAQLEAEVRNLESEGFEVFSTK